MGAHPSVVHPRTMLARPKWQAALLASGAAAMMCMRKLIAVPSSAPMILPWKRVKSVGDVPNGKEGRRERVGIDGVLLLAGDRQAGREAGGERDRQIEIERQTDRQIEARA